MAIIKISRGQRLKLIDIIPNNNEFELDISVNSPGLVIDCSCFGLNANGKLADDRYMTFFNQISTPCGSVLFIKHAVDSTGFAIKLQKLPTTIHHLTITAAIDGNGRMSQLKNSYVRFFSKGNEVARFEFTGADFSVERALMLLEIYRKDGIWRVSAVGQGFNGGLDALVKHFGGVVDDSTLSAQSSAESSSSLKKVSLEKKIEKEAPQLVNLVKKAAISLQKVELQYHMAKVALCLDVSGSMHGLYRAGTIQKFAERILALGCHFDDDGSIDIFLFADKSCHSGKMQIGNLKASLIQNMVDNNKVGGGTCYGPAMKEIRQFYFSEASRRKNPLKKKTPTYVMFVTDGGTSDENMAENQIEWSSYEPIFWQFMAIGKSKKDIKGAGFFNSLKRALASDFSFLERLDNMKGRLIDNANFFSVENPEIISDDELYELLMAEYPSWVKQAKSNGLIAQ